ncbi:MAG: outer membrane beta-barrel protein [Bacteroidaceae bacterium]|nr:outer membrane beta-barrel protein [Bacteroidaceae bacterium]
MKRLLIIMLLVGGIRGAVAQEILEYRWDIGGGLGLCYYLGDVNRTPFSGSSVMTAFTLRRNFNPRMSLKANLAYGRYSGTSKGYYLPEASGSTQQSVDVAFGGNVVDLGVQFELNFWGYGMGPGYKKLSRITPYAILGVGATVGINDGANSFGANFPVGAGVKYKVKPRLNLIFEWTHRFTTIDKLDGVRLSDPYYIESSGLKNKDTYSFFMFTLTYDISPKYRLCNN